MGRVAMEVSVERSVVRKDAVLAEGLVEVVEGGSAGLNCPSGKENAL